MDDDCVCKRNPFVSLLLEPMMQLHHGQTHSNQEQEKRRIDERNDPVSLIRKSVRNNCSRYKEDRNDEGHGEGERQILPDLLPERRSFEEGDEPKKKENSQEVANNSIPGNLHVRFYVNALEIVFSDSLSQS